LHRFHGKRPTPGYSESALRPGAVAVTSLVAAVLGAAGVLVVGKAAGWIGSPGKTRTVVVREPIGDAGRAAPVVAAKPLVGNGFQPAQIYRARSAGVVTIFAFFDDPASANPRAGQGSGFVVSNDGVVLTNAHVITTAGEAQAGEAAPAKEVYVEFEDGERVPAKIVGYDLFDDVGVIRVDRRAHALSPVPLGNSSRVVVGAPVAAIGSPFGNENSLTVGVVSATRREIKSLTSRFDLIDAIQTDAPINHGNSGGPLFDARGRVIGINAQIRSSEGSGFEGVGFAVPIDSAKRSMRELLATGKVAYAYVGISSEDLTPEIARKFGYGAPRGALVDKVVPETPADRAGLRAGIRNATVNGQQVTVGGDAIVAINGEPVQTASDVVRIVAERLAPGQVAKFTIVRGRKRLVLPLRLGARTP
jgi:S1-C subfamily serine protease